jgi:hypothetical protein
MIRVVHPGSRFQILIFTHSGSRIQGVKKAPDPRSGSATLTITGSCFFEQMAAVPIKSFFDERLKGPTGQIRSAQEWHHCQALG